MKKSLPAGWKRVNPGSDPLSPTPDEAFYSVRSLWEERNPNWAHYLEMAR